MEMPETCRTCRYWEEDLDGLGFCRRKKAHKMEKQSTKNAVNVVPQTWEYESCEEYA